MRTLNTSAASLALHMAAADKGASAPTPAPVPAPAAAATAVKAAPVIGAITLLPPPTNAKPRGSNSTYPTDKLEAPVRDAEGNVTGLHSFHVGGKTARQLSTITSNANRKSKVEKKDAEGKTVFKTKEVTGEGGVKMIVPTAEAEMVATKHFFAVDVDATDPNGVGARIYRDL